MFDRLLQQHGGQLLQPLHLLERDLRDMDFPAALARSLSLLDSLPP